MLLMLLTKLSVAVADDYVDVGNSAKPFISLTPYLGLLEDASQQLTLADIRKESLRTHFKTNLPPNQSINLSFTSSAYWLRLIIENSSDLPIEKIIEINHPLLKNVDFYWQIDQKVHQTIHTGYAHTNESRAYRSSIFAFPVQFAAHSQQVIYLRIATPNALFIEANLWEPMAFQKKELNYYAFQAFYFGILIMIFLFSLGLALVTKDVNYYIYVIMIFFIALTFLANRGLGSEYIWINVPWLAQRGSLIFGSFYLATQLLFVRRILNTKKLIPGLDLILKVLIGVAFMMPGLISFSFGLAFLVNIMFAVLSAFVALILVIACLKKQRNAYFLGVGFSLLIIGIIVRELHMLTLIQSNFYTINSIQLGSAFELVVITFFLTDRYRLIQHDKQLTDKRFKQSQINLLTEIKAHKAAVALQIALQASEEKLRNILELSPDGIGISNLEGIMSFVSDKTILMWGYTKEEFLGKHIVEVIDVSSHKILSNMMTELLKGNDLGAMDYDMVRKDGSHFICEVNCSLIFDIENKPINVLYIQRDVTERSKIAKELELAKKTAEQANQAKSVFVYNMSHELRTPLNIILGYSELLQVDTSLDAEQLDYAQEVSKGGKHLLDIINQMLDIAQIESGHAVLSIRPENISTIINECLRLAAPLAKQRAISLRYQPKHQIVTGCDRTRLIQLVLNLISNAIKYNFKQGTVDISLELNDTNDYTIHVIDSGLGMDPERLAKVYDPFVRLTTGEDIEGTGLGLSISQELVELMGGTIGVKSEPGVGSHFWIKLPLLKDTHEQIASSISSPGTYQRPEKSRRYQVLYIDDNAKNLKLIKKMLNAFPHLQLRTLQDSTQAITQVLLHRPDIILLDINMPEMDGYQVMSALQANEQLKIIPVIALTANAMLHDIERGRVAGFSCYLAKPIDQSLLIETIGQCFDLSL
jgi:PAS domain S-box-containing protein